MAMCRKPADDGRFCPRCAATVLDRETKTERQCRAAAERGTAYCGVHQDWKAETSGSATATDLTIIRHDTTDGTVSVYRGYCHLGMIYPALESEAVPTDPARDARHCTDESAAIDYLAGMTPEGRSAN